MSSLLFVMFGWEFELGTIMDGTLELKSLRTVCPSAVVCTMYGLWNGMEHLNECTECRVHV